MHCKAVLDQLRAMANPGNAAGMARYGISTEGTLGVPVPVLRNLARQIGRNHALALELWASGLHEAHLLAAFIDDPKEVTEAQMEAWVLDIDSWDVCDQLCGNLFDRTPFAYTKAAEWSRRPEEFVKRAGFVLMTQLAVHDKKAPDGLFLEFLPIIEEQADDDRNFVRKAVNWALRQIGKRNASLNRYAIASAHRLSERESRAAKWIARDALKELESPAVQGRLGLQVLA